MLKIMLMIFVLLNFTACSSWFTKRSPNQETSVVLKDSRGNTQTPAALPTSRDGKDIVPIQPGISSAQAQAEAVEMKKAVAAAAQHVQDTHESDTEMKVTTRPDESTDTTTTSHSARHAGPVAAEKSLGWLKNGNTRFVRGTFRKDGASGKDRKRLENGQKPHAIILSCSDSRVPPEVVFDQKLGEVFVIRVAGEALDNNVIGSIEYAIEHLGSNLVVVMGHESCGAVTAALASMQGQDLGSPALNILVSDLKPRLQQFASRPKTPGVLEESWANVDGVAKDLLERSAIMRDAVSSGDVKIVKAMYRLDSGRVEWQ